jgi:ATP-dependent DNA helicase Rep
MNSAQLEAVRYLDGPCLVIAGAGSGKTRVITQKIAHLCENGIDPRAISAITFTNKAALEMQARVKPLMEPLIARKEGIQGAPRVCTFHSLGVQILRRNAKSLGLKPQFSILDSDDQFGIVQQAMVTTDKKLVRTVMSTISLWKNALVTPDDAVSLAATNAEALAAKVFRDYDATLTAYQAVDFDDLIRMPVLLFRKDEAALSEWQSQIRYLLVDEYQDTNACQYELVKLLVGVRGALTAVGDDDQSIYGWRGATLENLRRLGDDFAQLKVIKLEQNYRSSVRILQAANAVISQNPKLHEKKLWSEHGMGDPVQVLAMDDEEHEAESVVARLQAHRFERRGKFEDYAILYRSNMQARIFEQALRKEKIPYVMSGGQSFFDRAEIRDLCSYLRLLANDDDDPAFIRAATTPKRGIGTATLTALGNYAGERQVSLFAALFETGVESRLAARQIEPLREFGEFVNRIAWRAAREPADQVLDDMIKAIDYQSHVRDSNDEKTAAGKWTNVTDFLDWLKSRAKEDNKNLLELAQQVALLSRLDQKDSQADAVQLSTLHAAKGLEYPHVFLVGVEEGLLPHLIPDDAAGDADASPKSKLAEQARVEEERRLMYVGITRAERSLFVTWCKQRKRAKTMLDRLPSRFIGEMRLEGYSEGQSKPEVVNPKERLALLKSMMKRPI